jgi:hypothetical protein
MDIEPGLAAGGGQIGQAAADVQAAEPFVHFGALSSSCGSGPLQFDQKLQEDQQDPDDQGIRRDAHHPRVLESPVRSVSSPTDPLS